MGKALFSRKRLIIVIVAIVLVAAVGVGMSWLRASQVKSPIYVAVIAPMTGAYQADGEDTVRGIQLYLDQLNATGGINGHPIELLTYDDQNNPDIAYGMALKVAVESQALVVFGHAFSDSSIKAGPVYKKYQIPAISGSSTTDAVTKDNPWYFRTIFNNSAQAAFMGNYVKTILGYNNVSIIYEDGTYGASMAEAFRDAFTGIGGAIVFDQGFDRESDSLTADLNQIVTDLAAVPDPGLVFLPAHVGPAAETIVMLRRNGLDYPVMGSSAFANIDFTQRFKDLPEEKTNPGYFTNGIYVTTPIIFDVANEKAQIFWNDFVARYGAKPGMKAATNYDAILVAVEAMRAAQVTGAPENRDAERQKVRDTLAAIKSPEVAVPGVTGRIYFDEEGNYNQAVAMGQYTGGELISTWVQLQPISDLNRIANLSDELAAGRILLNSTSSMYVTNIVYTGIDINEVTDLKIKDSLYTVDFYLWFRYYGTFDDANIEFLNATKTISLGKPIAETVTDEYTYRAYRVKAEFRNEFEFSDYPFDRQDIVIRFRHANLTRENLIYVRDTIGMQYTGDAAILETFNRNKVFNTIGGWHPISARFYQDTARSDSTLGNPKFFDSNSAIEYSRFNVAVTLQRDGLSFTLKNLFPLFIVIIISYLAFFMPPRQLAVTNGLLRTTLLAVAFFHQKLSSDLPGVGYVVALDYPFYIFYVIIVFSLTITTITHADDAQGKTERVKKLTNIGKVVYPLLTVIGCVWFAWRYELFTRLQVQTEPAATESLSLGPTLTPAADAQAANPLAGKELRILQWKHFVPRYDPWFDALTAKWGAENGVKVTVEHVDVTQIGPQLEQEIAAQAGHDLVEFVSPPSRFEPYVLDLTDFHRQAQTRFGEQIPLCVKSSYNPTTKKWYGVCHGWAPDPGNYRLSLWEQVGLPDGPLTYTDLMTGGARIRDELGVQMGIGMSRELDSNLATWAILWSFGASVQDEHENVILNSPETVAAVKYMADLYSQTMTSEVFNWTASSNNQGLFGGSLSYILNSISAYRTAQKTNPDVANDIFFTPALRGPDGLAFASAHVTQIYVIPAFAENPDVAQAFLLHFLANYAQATYNSELYTLPAWKRTAPRLYTDNGWLAQDPFGSQPQGKLALLRDAEAWTVNIGYPGPANAAIGEVFDTFILSDMVARVARGEMTAEKSVAVAADQVNAIFAKWREKGLVGGNP